MKQKTVKSAEGRRPPVGLCQPFVGKHCRLKHRPTLGLGFMRGQGARLFEVRLGAFRGPIPTAHFTHVQMFRELGVVVRPFPHSARCVMVRMHPVVRMVRTPGHDVAQLVAKLQRRQRRPNAQEEHGGAQGCQTAQSHGAKLGASPVLHPTPRSQVSLTSSPHEPLS